jgi:hypothetical protein
VYFAYKFWAKTKIIPLAEIPIRPFIESWHKNPELWLGIFVPAFDERPNGNFCQRDDLRFCPELVGKILSKLNILWS